jgi:hypothetical protein
MTFIKVIKIDKDTKEKIVSYWCKKCGQQFKIIPKRHYLNLNKLVCK